IIEAPAAEPVEPVAGPMPWLLSAKSEPALRSQARKLQAFLAEHPDVPPAEVGTTLAVRAHLPHRAVVTGLAGLDTLAHKGTVTEGRTAFVFSGEGGQWAGMGRRFYAEFPAFAKALDEVCDQLDLTRELLFDDPESVLDQPFYARAAVFALEVAL